MSASDNQSERMKLLLSSLLLLCSHSTPCVSLVVTQSPDVCVLEAETVKISCCWRGNHSRVGVKWLKNQALMKDETIKLRSQGSPDERGDGCSTLSFSRITRKDSGRYVCKVSVEIPVLIEGEGNGTTVTVTPGENGDDVTEPPTESTTRSTTRSTTVRAAAERTKPDVPSASLVVHQSPNISVLEGETVNISCCWKGRDRRVGVKWLKNTTYVKKEVVITRSQDSPSEQVKSCSALSFLSITREDSGRYTCSVSVEIPVLTEAKGNGTTVTVTAREKTPTETSAASLEDLLPFVMRCLPILTLITAFFWLYYLGMKAQEDTPSSATENEAASAQSREEDQGEDETPL